jgi:tetratricopeptide (TPR) repeat protein
MVRISLRAYLHEIENLIDRGELDQAQAHCKQILNIYPKNIDTYRLLGKSYLEGQKYKEAEDIFQRVLSVIPDDFISQVGMSIINEEAGKLDAAIWHMEKAYEVQPSNIPIMNEIKRLYGRRDGVEPPKVRLTRGALVRMYARTKLIPQAIAETRAALEEDPNRIDLELILARMYYLSGQKVEASEICTKIISHLPYCLEANRILGEILPQTSRAEEAKNVIERVNSLDPYAAYISQNTPTSDLVPDNAIMLEQLDNVSGSSGFVMPSSGSVSETASAEPDWFKALATEQSESSPSPVAQGSESLSPTQNQNQVPDWMKEAGWVPSENLELTPPLVPPSNEDQGKGEESEEAVPAEMPDWLKDLQSQNLPAVENEPASTESVLNPFINALAPETPPTQPSEASPSDIPDWLGLDKSNVEINPTQPTEEKESKPTESKISGQSPIESADVPEWLNELKPQPTEESMGSREESLILPPPIPEINESQPFTFDEKPTEAPFVQSLGENSISDKVTPEIPQDWIEEVGIPGSSEKTGPLIPTADIPEWLKNIEINPEGEESLKTSTESSSEPISGDVPDWLKELQEIPQQPESVEENKTVEEPKMPEETPQKNESNLQQWLTSLEKEATSTVQDENRISAPSELNPEPIQPAPIKEGFFEFQNAKDLLDKDDIDHSLPIFKKLIKSRHLVEEIITELKNYSKRNSSNARLWQAIGDAYARHNDLREALDSYNKAEDLLK